MRDFRCGRCVTKPVHLTVHLPVQSHGDFRVVRNSRRWRKRIAILSCLALVAQTGCDQKDERPVSSRPRKPNSESPNQEGWTSSMTLTRAGKLQAVVRYGHMAEYLNRRIALFDQGIQVDFFDVKGRHISRLTSIRGEYSEDTEDVAAEDHVVVVSDTGVTLQTDRLKWDHRTGKIFTNDPVTIITKDGGTVTGLGFESNADLSNWSIPQPRGVAKRGVDLKKIEQAIAAKDSGTASIDSSNNRRRSGP